MRTLEDFFGTYPECEQLGFKWVGNEKGEATDKSNIFIWNEYPVEPAQFPAVVVQIDASQSPIGLGNSAQTNNDAITLDDGRTAYGSYRGMFLQGNIKHSIVSLRKTDHHTITSLLTNHYNYVLNKMMASKNINCKAFIKNIKITDNKFLASQRIYMTQFDVEFQTMMREFVPESYNHYLIHMDANKDGRIEKYFIENHEISGYRTSSVRVYNYDIDDWEATTTEIAEIIVEELLKRIEEGTEELIKIEYITQERVLSHDAVITTEGGHILEDALVPLRSKIETTHIDDKYKIPPSPII